MKKIDPKKDSQSVNNLKRWDVKTLKENFGGVKKIDPRDASIKKELFFKFSFSY